MGGDVVFPIRNIVLFKHGVGYFERMTKVSGDSTIELFFKSSDVDDVLKSLAAVDISGGHISSMSYQSQKPISKQLEELCISLKNGTQTLSELITEGIGAPVCITMMDEDDLDAEGEVLKGVVAGLETTRGCQRVNLLVEGRTLRSVNIANIRSFTFLDPTIRADLQHLLDILLLEKKKGIKKLSIFANGGETPRTIVASYVIATAVWKSSYRLIMTPDGAILQGWALVDNTQEEDWAECKLSLVGGVFNSFKHDLYSPRFKKRPVIEVKHDAPNKAPPSLNGLLPFHDESLLVDAAAMLSSLSEGGAQMLQRSAAPDAALPSQHTNVSQFVPPSANAAHLRGAVKKQRKVEDVDYFTYEIKDPITVRRGQSALVPFIQGKFEGGVALLYSPGINKTNPLSVVRFVNSYSTSLDAGPITIFDNDKCIGEAMLDTIRAGDTKFLPFGTERNVQISQESSTALRNYHRATLSATELNFYNYKVQTYKYKVKNRSARTQQLYLEHKIDSNYELSPGTPEPALKTSTAYRFLYELKPNNTETFVVLERMEQRRTYPVRNLNVTDMVRYKKYLPDDIHAKLKNVVELKATYQESVKAMQTAQNDLKQRVNEQAAKATAVRSTLETSTWFPTLEDSGFTRMCADMFALEGPIAQAEDKLADLVIKTGDHEIAWNDSMSSLPEWAGAVTFGSWKEDGPTQSVSDE